MKRMTRIATIVLAASILALAGCGESAKSTPGTAGEYVSSDSLVDDTDVTDDEQFESDTDYEEPKDIDEADANEGSSDSGYIDVYGQKNERKSIYWDAKDYEPGNGSSSDYESTPDPRYSSAVSMLDYVGCTYSSDDVDLEFVLTDVSDEGNQIQVVFDKCQYPLSGIDLGTTYTGQLEKIDSQNYVMMKGYYVYEIPYMDLWEDGSRHEDTFYLKFSFGSKDEKGEFCTSKIGLLGDTLYLR